MCIVLYPQGFDTLFDHEVQESTEGVLPEFNFRDWNMGSRFFSGKKVWIPNKIQLTRLDGLNRPNEAGGPLNRLREVICSLECISTAGGGWLLEEAAKVVEAGYVRRYVQT